MDLWDDDGPINFFDDAGDGDILGDENVDPESEFINNKDCIIFLIDCQKPMFLQNDRGEIPFENALKCAIATLTDKIISSENDLVGVCFYGTDKKKNPNDFDAIFVLQDLDVPDAQRIMELENLIRGGDFSDFGHTNADFPFCDALWACSTMFSNCSVKVGHKRIFLFTNEDNPNVDSKNLREQSFQRAKDLAELGIDVELFSMNKPDETFDPTKFYQYIISVSEDEDTGAFNYDASSKFEELRARVRRKEFKKRSITRVPFFIGPDTEIAIRVYNLVQSTKKGSFVWLDGRTNQPVKTMTKWVCEDTGSLLMDTQIKYSYEYGGERVIFDKDELAAIKTIDKKGLRLMGFKPRSALKTYFNLKHSSFIYPDEQAIQGSTVAFAALLDRMLALDKMAIVRWTPRDNAPPRMAALLPQAESMDEDGVQINPPGFHVIPLPYADDIRNPDLPEQRKATTEQIIKAKKVVKALRINFDSRSFENPALQKHYANLQALALDRDSVEEINDYLLPDVEGMSNFSALIKDFRDAIFPEGYTPATGTKRKREPGDPEAKRAPKKALLEDSEVRDLYAQGMISKMTIPQLKGYLVSVGVAAPSKLKKGDLVTLLENYLADEGGAAPVKEESEEGATRKQERETEDGEEEEGGGKARKRRKVKKEEEIEDGEKEKDPFDWTGSLGN